MHREHLDDIARNQTLEIIKTLLRPARAGNVEARNKLLNLVTPTQQAKQLDRWDVSNDRLFIDSLGRYQIN